ncbi:methionyl-tRNA formyltransferase [Engelhardtia mirabilis]|uniref:Methionyl-tRNA formyltransferase n=1 Tax=Engelhardtia mirabilis TaxID=2528011 RepID=A0A518BDH5_9BACT|nr:Methionyl-tRNA formyltransferase [Planctomycetes bacterium Pla133]QDU99279.1 Methionyl-tRNA formyltransferase [Planctomycetes bacterium Pla86]
MTAPIRVVFFGSPPFATPIVERLLSSEHRPVAVVTPPDRPAGRGRAAQSSPVAVLTDAAGVELLRPESTREMELRARLRALDADVFLVASYGELFDQELLAMPARACLNVHGSLLPRWRGAAPVQAAILAGDSVTGVSVQRMVRGLDAGDVLLSRETPIGPETTGGELFDRLAHLGADAAIAALDLIAAGDAHFTPQDPEAVTRCRKLDKRSGVLDWSDDAAALERRVRAMNPRPGARTTLADGRVLGVKRAAVVGGSSGAPGTPDPAALDQGRLVIHAGRGALELLEVQPAGKRPMLAADFLRGARIDPEVPLGQEQE